MMDAVYVNRDGENPELRYSLRSLAHAPHRGVWVFGGAPHWLNTDRVSYVPRPQKLSSYLSTRAHLQAACETDDVSDPFTLWNDDFYAMRPTSVIWMHRGPLADLIRQFAQHRTPWVKGMTEAATILNREGIEDPLSYDTHHPMIVHKEEMLAALRLVRNARVDAVHLRTIYANLIGGGGTLVEDCKLLKRTDPFPRGPWLSSGDGTYRSTIEPVLRYTFPDPCIYEKGPS